MDQKQKEQDVEARREARRRKILENAEKRLGKITGREINGKSACWKKKRNQNHVEYLIVFD